MFWSKISTAVPRAFYRLGLGCNRNRERPNEIDYCGPSRKVDGIGQCGAPSKVNGVGYAGAGSA